MSKEALEVLMFVFLGWFLTNMSEEWKLWRNKRAKSAKKK